MRVRLWTTFAAPSAAAGNNRRAEIVSAITGDTAILTQASNMLACGAGRC
jgi:hypothetical protein